MSFEMEPSPMRSPLELLQYLCPDIPKTEELVVYLSGFESKKRNLEVMNQKQNRTRQTYTRIRDVDPHLDQGLVQKGKCNKERYLYLDATRKGIFNPEVSEGKIYARVYASGGDSLKKARLEEKENGRSPFIFFLALGKQEFNGYLLDKDKSMILALYHFTKTITTADTIKTQDFSEDDRMLWVEEVEKDAGYYKGVPQVFTNYKNIEPTTYYTTGTHFDKEKHKNFGFEIDFRCNSDIGVDFLFTFGDDTLLVFCRHKNIGEILAFISSNLYSLVSLRNRPSYDDDRSPSIFQLSFDLGLVQLQQISIRKI
eukprot:TRINITY_DN4174_c0_g2_i3.p1 TRINITY_DN4174_c0_g2~~TRINITY_DN4174_c0_g2_i3.p1  ORF type:complete len:312 (+),score=48.74 TRINITY_DN4174_c0_g2_i3:122-1057(+)